MNTQLQHTVESIDGDAHLGRPTLVRARAQPVTDDLLEPDCRPETPMISGRYSYATIPPGLVQQLRADQDPVADH